MNGNDTEQHVADVDGTGGPAAADRAATDTLTHSGLHPLLGPVRARAAVAVPETEAAWIARGPNGDDQVHAHQRWLRAEQVDSP